MQTVAAMRFEGQTPNESWFDILVPHWAEGQASLQSLLSGLLNDRDVI